MTISGKIGNTDSVRPLEVTVINRSEVVLGNILQKENLYTVSGSGVNLRMDKFRNQAMILIWLLF